jgi:hypothetical protein
MTYFVEGLTNVNGSASSVRRIGEYETLPDAIRVSERLIEEFLTANLESGMTVADLFSQYQNFGEFPFIFCDDARTINVSGFNHFRYAMEHCNALCTRNESAPAN